MRFIDAQVKVVREAADKLMDEQIVVKTTKVRPVRYNIQQTDRLKSSRSDRIQPVRQPRGPDKSGSKGFARAHVDAQATTASSIAADDSKEWNIVKKHSGRTTPGSWRSGESRRSDDSRTNGRSGPFEAADKIHANISIEINRSDRREGDMLRAQTRQQGARDKRQAGSRSIQEEPVPEWIDYVPDSKDTTEQNPAEAAMDDLEAWKASMRASETQNKDKQQTEESSGSEFFFQSKQLDNGDATDTYVQDIKKEQIPLLATSPRLESSSSRFTRLFAASSSPENTILSTIPSAEAKTAEPEQQATQQPQPKQLGSVSLDDLFSSARAPNGQPSSAATSRPRQEAGQGMTEEELLARLGVRKTDSKPPEIDSRDADREQLNKLLMGMQLGPSLSAPQQQSTNSTARIGGQETSVSQRPVIPFGGNVPLSVMTSMTNPMSRNYTPPPSQNQQPKAIDSNMTKHIRLLSKPQEHVSREQSPQYQHSQNEEMMGRNARATQEHQQASHQISNFGGLNTMKALQEQHYSNQQGPPTSAQFEQSNLFRMLEQAGNSGGSAMQNRQPQTLSDYNLQQYQQTLRQQQQQQQQHPQHHHQPQQLQHQQTQRMRHIPTPLQHIPQPYQGRPMPPGGFMSPLPPMSPMSPRGPYSPFPFHHDANRPPFSPHNPNDSFSPLHPPNAYLHMMRPGPPGPSHGNGPLAPHQRPMHGPQNHNGTGPGPGQGMPMYAPNSHQMARPPGQQPPNGLYNSSNAYH